MKPSLKKLLKKGKFPEEPTNSAEAKLQKLQLRMLRIQQGVWHQKKRAIILFEGFDAAGKGGAIRRLTESLDPRGVRVHAFAAPKEDEQGRHYLYRFWKALPKPGQICVFDRSWYGRVLVERVEKLTSKERWKQAFEEINQIERMLSDDGIDLVKIFLGISAEEQLRRFEDRLKDPYKQWKFTKDDVRARENWDKYVEAAEEMFEQTHTKGAPWNLIAADDKDYARVKVMETVTAALHHHFLWMEEQASGFQVEKLGKLLKRAAKV